MNIQRVISELKQQYPDGNVIENMNALGETTEIIGEIVSPNPDESRAIAVIDSSVVHYHKVITETYKVLKGKLTVLKYTVEKKIFEEIELNTGDSITIKPGELHSNLGDETWVEVISNPAWFIEDFINMDTLLKKYSSKDK
jgi:mannose-6-phosphate isomerase-like protein (cupin superfamily)